MRTTIAELVAVLAMDSTKFQKGLTQAETASMKMGKNLSSMGKRMSTMVTLPIAIAGVAITKMAMDFETQMANIFTLMDDATIHSRDWKNEVLDLSKRVPQSTDVLAKGLYDIVSAGIDAGKAMDVLEVASKSATAGLTDTAVSADAITSVLNAYGLEAEDATDVSDVLFTTIKYGKTTFAELGPQIGKVVATAAAAGVSFDEVGAALATMTISGLKTDQAIVGLNQTILAFLKPTDEAKEVAAELGFDLSATTLATMGLGGAMTELSQKLGISVDDMIAMEQAGLSDAEMYDELANKTGKSAEMMAELFPNIRALKGALILAKDEGAKFNEMLEKQETRLGATEEAFAKIAETTAFKFDLALSSLKATAIEMGTHLLPIASDLFTKIGELADKFGNLSDAQQQTIIKILGIVAAIGPLLFLTGKAITTTIALKKAYMALRAVMVTASTSMGVLGIGLVTLGTLVYAGIKIWDSYKWSLAETEDKIYDVATAEKALYDAKKKYTTVSFINTKEFDAQIKAIDLDNERAESIKDMVKLYPELEDKVVKVARAYEDANDKIKLTPWDATEEDIKENVKALKDAEDAYAELGDEMVEFEKLMETDKIDNFTEAQIRSREAIEQYSSVYPELADRLTQYDKLLEAGIINETKYKEGIEEIIDPLLEYRRLLDMKNDAEEYGSGLTREQSIAFHKLGIELGFIEEAEDDLVGSVDDGTEALEAQEKAADDLRKAFNKLIDDIFGLTNAENDLQESEWALADIEKELQKLRDEGKEGLREYEEKINDYDRELQNNLTTLRELYTEEGISIERKEELRQKLVDLLIQTKKTSGLSQEEYIKMAEQWGLSGAEIIVMAEEVGIELDELERERIINIQAQIDKNFYANVNAVKSAINEIGTGYMMALGQGYKSGGLVEAQEGLFASAGNARPVLIHPPEVILNKDQALNVLWNMANQPVGASGGSSVINNYINVEQANIRDDSDIDMLSEQISRRIYEEDQLRHRGVGIK